MADEYRFCPRCGGEEISETDYEDEEGNEDTEGRHCDSCHWEGDVSELEAKE